MPYEFKNIHSHIDRNPGPIIVRFDVNSPVTKNGRISLNNGDINLRLDENGYLKQTPLEQANRRIDSFNSRLRAEKMSTPALENILTGAANC